VVTLDGFDAKFNHAATLAAILEQQISDYLASAPFQLTETVEPDSGHLVVTAHIRTPPPVAWSILIGDALHNARSALDHLAWQLVEMHGGPPDKSRFPFTDSPVGFGKELHRAHIPAAVRKQVRALEPWRGGDDQLWLLHHLDIIDKHRLLVPVAAASRGINIHMSMTWPGKEAIQIDPIALLSADRHIPLRDGDEVFRDQTYSQTHDTSFFQTRVSPTFHVIFGDGSEVAGEEVGPTVRDLIAHARETVEPLVAIVRGSSAHD
jgi:hypothetical protein